MKQEGPPPAPPRSRGGEPERPSIVSPAPLLAILRGAADATRFTPTFLEQVPFDRVSAIAADLRAANGLVVGVERVEAEGLTQALFHVAYEQATVSIRVAVEPAAPHRIIGLLVTQVARRDDSAEKIVADLSALPGRTALLVTPLGDGAKPLVAHNAVVPMASASQFKLFVLAELAAQIAAGQRRWTDVVPLGPASLPSGVTQGWPVGAPVTLSTLAIQMMSISDNTATDTLLTVLGRDRVDALRASVGSTSGALPVLSTREAFSLKTTRNTSLREAWQRGTLAERRALLRSNAWPLAAIDMAELVGAPRAIDTVEWPATATEIAGVLDRLRRADPATLDVLAVASGLPTGTRERFTYVGFKGGSEPGVIALAWLLRTKEGRWFAVSGAWNDASAPVDLARFTALMMRAVALVE